MVKTSTLEFHPSVDLKPKKNSENSEPSDSVIQNILNYSKALESKKTKQGKYLMNVLN